jgi:hypothetical protein
MYRLDIDREARPISVGETDRPATLEGEGGIFRDEGQDLDKKAHLRGKSVNHPSVPPLLV